MLNNKTFVFFLFCFILGGVAAYRIMLGVIPDVFWAHDVPHHLDAGWRIAQGQIPRIDYYQHAYELYHLVLAGFLVAFGPNISAMTDTHVFFLVFLSLASWSLFSARFTPRWTLLLSVVMIILLVGTSPLGWDYAHITHGEFHNRINWALLTLVCIYSFFDSQTPHLHLRLFDSMLAGLLIGCLLLMKSSYFLEAVAAVGLGTYYRSIKIKNWIPLAVGFNLIFIPYTFFIHGQWHHYITDSAALLASYHQDTEMIVFKLRNGLPYLAFLPAVYLLAQKIGVLDFELERLIYFYLFIVLAGLGILLTNLPQGTDSVLYIVIPLLALRYVKAIRSHWVLLAIVATSGSWLLNSLLSLPYTQYVERQNALADSSVRMKSQLNSVAYQGWWAGSGGGPCAPNAWVERMNEGLSLLKSNTTPSAKISTLDYMNIFPFALKRPAPAGGSILFHYGLNVNERHVPKASQLFRDTSAVRGPTFCPENEAALILIEKYENYLQKNYPVVVEGQYWTLRKKN